MRGVFVLAFLGSAYTEPQLRDALTAGSFAELDASMRGLTAKVAHTAKALQQGDDDKAPSTGTPTEGGDDDQKKETAPTKGDSDDQEKKPVAGDDTPSGKKPIITPDEVPDTSRAGKGEGQKNQIVTALPPAGQAVPMPVQTNGRPDCDNLGKVNQALKAERAAELDTDAEVRDLEDQEKDLRVAVGTSDEKVEQLKEEVRAAERKQRVDTAEVRKLEKKEASLAEQDRKLATKEEADALAAANLERDKEVKVQELSREQIDCYDEVEKTGDCSKATETNVAKAFREVSDIKVKDDTKLRDVITDREAEDEDAKEEAQIGEKKGLLLKDKKVKMQDAIEEEDALIAAEDETTGLREKVAAKIEETTAVEARLVAGKDAARQTAIELNQDTANRKAEEDKGKLERKKAAVEAAAVAAAEEQKAAEAREEARQKRREAEAAKKAEEHAEEERATTEEESAAATEESTDVPNGDKVDGDDE